MKLQTLPAPKRALHPLPASNHSQREPLRSLYHQAFIFPVITSYKYTIQYHSFVSSFFLFTSQNSSMLPQVTIDLSFSLLSNVPLYKQVYASILLVLLTGVLYELSCSGGHILLSFGCFPGRGIVGLRAGLYPPEGFVAVSLKVDYTATMLFTGGVLPSKLLRQPGETKEAEVGSQEI